jgi:hypothetical protein
LKLDPYTISKKIFNLKPAWFDTLAARPECARSACIEGCGLLRQGSAQDLRQQRDVEAPWPELAEGSPRAGFYTTDFRKWYKYKTLQSKAFYLPRRCIKD